MDSFRVSGCHSRQATAGGLRPDECKRESRKVNSTPHPDHLPPATARPTPGRAQGERGDINRHYYLDGALVHCSVINVG